MSIDGYIAGLNGEMDWMVWDWDDELKNYVDNLTKPVDTIVLGRKLAEGFIDYWGEKTNDPELGDFARKMYYTQKVVFTKTMKEHKWNNTSLSGDLKEIKKLKEQNGQDIIAYGGGAFVSSLIKEGLIDDFHLFVNPTALGKGMPIFEELENRQTLKLVEARPFACGITLLHYTK